eukprot:TRINITY_DN15412_c0_g1_i1.p1 TRINITY_DN15412_c0_g1~~TRINITY_DN15412_c0_g1_i1.p1  ORF type:complete len:840 (-),score=128.29 TRINITY_DN15412_c0_g1_i1:152-2671(-)
MGVQELIDVWLATYIRNNEPEVNKFQTSVLHVQMPNSEDLVEKVVVLGKFRFFMFEGSAVLPAGDWTAESLSKRLGSDVLDIHYYDLVGFYHDGFRNLSVYTQAQGQLKVNTFRSAQFEELVQLMEEMIHLRGAISGNLPEVQVDGPPVNWSRVREPFKPSHKTHHFCETYQGWCNYRNTNANPVVPLFIKWLEKKNQRELNLGDCPLYTKSEFSVMMNALWYDDYFNSLIITDKQGNDFIFAIADMISHNRVLRKLVVRNIKADKDAFDTLCQAYANSKSHNLQVLDMSENVIDVKIEGLVTAISSYSTPLTYLNLSNCSLPPQSLTSLFGALLSNGTVSLSLTHFDVSFNTFDDKACTAFNDWISKYCNSMQLTTLSVAGASCNISTAFSFVHNIRTLTELNVMKTDLKDNDITMLTKIVKARPSNRKLNLCDTGFGKHPDKSVNLVTVLLEKTSQAYSVDLNLTNCRAIAAGIPSCILPTSTNLTHINLTGIGTTHEVFCEILLNLTGLERLSTAILNGALDSNSRPPNERVKDSIINFVSSTPSLRELGLADGFGLKTLSALFKAIADPTSTANITSLDISQNELGDKGASKVASFLEKDKNLKFLNLDSNSITHDGWYSIYLSLFYNITLEHIQWPTKDSVEYIESWSPTLMESSESKTSLGVKTSSSALKRIKVSKQKLKTRERNIDGVDGHSQDQEYFSVLNDIASRLKAVRKTDAGFAFGESSPRTWISPPDNVIIQHDKSLTVEEESPKERGRKGSTKKSLPPITTSDKTRKKSSSKKSDKEIKASDKEIKAGKDTEKEKENNKETKHKEKDKEKRKAKSGKKKDQVKKG